MSDANPVDPRSLDPNGRPEIRCDPIVDRQVIFAPGRAHQPNDFVSRTGQPAAETDAAHPSMQAPCPFCAGSEHCTPAATYEQRVDGDWTVRVVPNRYPAVDFNEAILCGGVPPADGEPTNSSHPMPAVGAHEVIIESPRHVRWTGELSVAEFENVLRAYRDRIEYWASVGWARSALLFKNVGSQAGASLSHLHSQLLVLPWIPASLRAEIDSAGSYHRRHGRCIFCDLIQSECDAASRIVQGDSAWLAITAYAGRRPLETWVLPRAHQAAFEELAPDSIAQLAVFLWSVLRKIEQALPNVGYNVILHSSPFDRTKADYYHWHIEIIPRVTQFAGLEMGGGLFLQTVTPERAAAMLRDIKN